jgi:hypothetical protein
MYIRRNLTLPLLMLILPAMAQAQFTIATNNGSIIITGYTGPGGVVVIPDTINGLPVTAIWGGAFSGCSSLLSVIIPDSLTTIQTSAFGYCHNLASVTFSNSVVSTPQGGTRFRGVNRIGAWAFERCTSLTNVTIPGSVAYIDIAAFSFCTNLTAINVDATNAALTSVNGVLFNKGQTKLLQYPGGKAGGYVIPDSVTNIEWFAFKGATRLTSVLIPHSTVSIGVGTFESCISLAGAPIPDSIVNIGGSSFYSCISLTNVSIPSSVTNIGSGAFASCTSLPAIAVDPSNPNYSSLDGVLFDKNLYRLVQYPAGKATRSYCVPNSVTEIGRSAFMSCTSLATIAIGHSVTSIGGYAFAGCASLASVTIPDNVTRVEGYLFQYCPRLSSVTIGNGITLMWEWTFGHCTNLTNVTFGNSITNIAYAAFFGCSGLTNVTIPSNISTIDWFAFRSCFNLRGVYFQGNAPSAGSYVFDGTEATVYYLPGTIGWGPTFAERPTKLWNPIAQAGDASFGVRFGQFGFNITGTKDIPIVVEACSNLADPAWTALQNCTLTNGSIYFSDSHWKNHPALFYRIRSP